MDLSEEQILTLAPDESSKKAGKDLAGSAKWVSKGINELALWGECQGSGSKPYQTQVDITNIAFKCSCPSRKFPCKHGLGLLLFYSRQKAAFTENKAPAWVEDWISKRAEKVEKRAEESTKQEGKPADGAAQVKRQLGRKEKVNDGIDELLLWIRDIVRNGIIGIPEKGPGWFENIARRMIDAQAPGLAGMIRVLAGTPTYKEGWQTEFMEQLLRIYMTIRGYRNVLALNEFLQSDMHALVGFTQNQEELKEQQGVNDNWLVLGKQVTEEDNLTTERYWLFGSRTRQYALILQFLVRGQGGSQQLLTPGMQLEAELVFFPSITPLRAIIKRQVNTRVRPACMGFTNWTEVRAFENELSSKLPVQYERPYIITQLLPVRYLQQWWLQDNRQQLMPLKEPYRNIWKLLAVSGGMPLDMAVVGQEKGYEPLGFWQENDYKLV